MIRYLASLCFALFSAAAAALPSAPFTDQAIERIDSAWAVNAEGFQQELATVNQGSPEAYYVLGRYMSAAFEGAGYSLDETLYTYLAKSGPGTTQMHLFMQKMNLGPLIMNLNNAQYRDALLNSGALSMRTVKFAQKQDPKAPIAEADFILEGDPGYPSDPNAYRLDYLQTGRVLYGQGTWSGWIMFSPGHFANPSSGVGIVEVASAGQGERELLETIIQQNKMVKVQGFTIRNAAQYNIFDPGRDLLVQFMQ